MRYITRKDIPLEQFYTVMKGLRLYYRIVTLGGAVVDKAYQIETKDFEDALQYYAAEQAGADCVVTRNLKDFDFEFTVETLEPQDFLSKYFPEEI
jgi:predicted nucleic acid-binding protein